MSNFALLLWTHLWSKVSNWPWMRPIKFDWRWWFFTQKTFIAQYYDLNRPWNSPFKCRMCCFVDAVNLIAVSIHCIGKIEKNGRSSWPFKSFEILRFIKLHGKNFEIDGIVENPVFVAFRFVISRGDFCWKENSPFNPHATLFRLCIAVGLSWNFHCYQFNTF